MEKPLILDLKIHNKLTFLDLKFEALREFSITQEIQQYYLYFDELLLNNEDFIFGYLQYFSERNSYLKFYLKQNIEKNMIELKKEKNEKKKTQEIDENYYFNEIAYLEADIKLSKIKHDQEEFKKGNSELNKKLQQISENTEKEIQKKVDDLNSKNKNFLDLEDQYFNVKETCFEIEKLENAKREQQEYKIRNEKIKKDDPILITYKDVFKFRAKESCYFFLYLFCLCFFMVNHKFSSFSDSIEINSNNFVKDILIKNPIFKHFIGVSVQKENKMSFIKNKKQDYFLNTRNDLLIYQLVLLNNIFSKNFSTFSNDYESIGMSLNKSGISWNGPNSYTQFNHKLSKKSYFENKQKDSLDSMYGNQYIVDDEILKDNINTFLPELKENINYYNLDLTDSFFCNDNNDYNFPVKFSLLNYSMFNVPIETVIKKIMNPTNYSQILDKSRDNINLTIYYNFDNKTDSNLKGLFRNYDDNGYKLYYDFSDHDPLIYSFISKKILKKFYNSDDLKFINFDLTIRHKYFQVPIRIVINFELSNLGLIHSEYKINMLDFNYRENVCFYFLNIHLKI